VQTNRKPIRKSPAHKLFGHLGRWTGRGRGTQTKAPADLPPVAPNKKEQSRPDSNFQEAGQTAPCYDWAD
jgi:hypothetical protein